MLFSAFISIFSTSSAYAGRIEPIQTKCWYFVLEQVEIRHTCVYESTSWTGGGSMSLLWEDGVKTQMSWGLQGRGEYLCNNIEDITVDGVCGSTYFRDSVSLNRLAKSEAENRWRSGPEDRQTVAKCIQLQRSSVCWVHPY